PLEATMDPDRNLVFGVLALRAGLIDESRFVDACLSWEARKDISLPELLVERSWLTPAERSQVENLLAARTLLSPSPRVDSKLPEVTDEKWRRVLAVLADLDLDPTSAEAPAPDQRYTRTALHAQGGIGQVWKAQDRHLGRHIALKELRPENALVPI